MEMKKVLEVSTTVGRVHDSCCWPVKSLAASHSQQVGKLEFWGIPQTAATQEPEGLGTSRRVI